MTLRELLEQAAEAAMRAKMFTRGTPHEHHYANLARELERAASSLPSENADV